MLIKVRKYQFNPKQMKILKKLIHIAVLQKPYFLEN